MASTLQPGLDGLASLLRSWNGGETPLTPQNCENLICLVRLELGAAEPSTSCEAADVDRLSNKLRPLLPTNSQGQTVADVFTEIRDHAAKELKVPPETIAWDSTWTSIDSAGPLARWIRADFLDEVVIECHAALDEPWELVGETVRWLWKARGGHPFWHLPSYEYSWCPSQGIFYDFRQIPALHQRSAVERIEPSTPLSALVSKKEHSVLLDSIDRRFGVWLGRYEKEGCQPLLLASILVSPLSLIIACCITISISETGKVAEILPFLIYGLCIAIAAMLYVRSQPRFPSTLATVKDVVRAIVHKRHDAKTQRSRLRPICVSTRQHATTSPR